MMKVDGKGIDEGSLRDAEAECVSYGIPQETHAAKWSRPRLQPFDSKDKTIAFQVGYFQLAVDVCRASSSRTDNYVGQAGEVNSLMLCLMYFITRRVGRHAVSGGEARQKRRAASIATTAFQVFQRRGL